MVKNNNTQKTYIATFDKNERNQFKMNMTCIRLHFEDNTYKHRGKVISIHSHFLPDMAADGWFPSFLVCTPVPRTRHGNKMDIVRKSPLRKLGVVHEPHRLVCHYLISPKLPIGHDFGVGQEVDYVASFSPRVHDDVVYLLVPDEGDHAVDSIFGIFGVGFRTVRIGQSRCRRRDGDLAYFSSIAR